MRSVGLSLLGAVVADLSDDWMDWECPGFPCSIVNYYDHRPHDNYQSACTPLSTMYECGQLMHGEGFFADDDGTIFWHNNTNPARPHNEVCNNNWGGCAQIGCLQGTRSKCYALCDRLNLIYPYEDRCKLMCRQSCPEDPSEMFACSECEANGQGADQCGCGYCGSQDDCEWTCGKDPNHPPTGAQCINLPPAPAPTPIGPRPPPTPKPNPNLPAGGCCSWAGPREIDECGDSTTWCKANAANCEGCGGHWACPDGPCPAV